MQKERSLKIQKIQEQLKETQAEACLISTTVNTYYLHQCIFKGYTYIDTNGQLLVFVKRPAVFRANQLQLDEKSVFHIRKTEQVREIIEQLSLNIPETLLLEGEEIGYTEWMRLQACFPKTKCLNGSHVLRKARSVKTPFELEQIRRSAEMHVKVQNMIPDLYRPGMSDTEFAIEIEHAMRQHGNLGLFRTYGNDMEAFMGSLLSGDNAAAASPYDFALGGSGHPSNPIGANRSPMLKGQSILVDMCGNFTGYLDDLSRCYSLGKLNEKAYKAHQTAIAVQHAVEEQLREGCICEDIYRKALDIVAKEGLSDCFMGTRQQAKFIGHGVGLVINELPVLAERMKDPLQEGMVLAIEPKFVIEGVGPVGIENTFIVGKNRGEKITLVEEGIIDLLN